MTMWIFKHLSRQIDFLTEITITGEELQRSGHPKYQRYWTECKSLEELEQQSKDINKELLNWKKTLRTARDSNFYLNYFHPNQLWVLRDFFNGSHSAADEALTLLRFVDNTITIDDINAFHHENEIQGSDQLQISQIAICLETFFSSNKSGCVKEQGEKVPKGGLSVVALEKDSTQTASIIMKLFQNTPLQPNRILFCHNNSAWDEIELFLRRCFADKNRQQYTSLPCKR